MTRCAGCENYGCVKWDCPYCNHRDQGWTHFSGHAAELDAEIKYHYEDHKGGLHVVDVLFLEVGGLWIPYFKVTCAKCWEEWDWRPIRHEYCASCGNEYRIALPNDCAFRTPFRRSQRPELRDQGDLEV